MASPKECKKTLVEIGDKKKSKADPDEGTDLKENGDEQDLEDRASKVSDSKANADDSDEDSQCSVCKRIFQEYLKERKERTRFKAKYKRWKRKACQRGVEKPVKERPRHNHQLNYIEDACGGSSPHPQTTPPSNLRILCEHFHLPKARQVEA